MCYASVCVHIVVVDTDGEIPANSLGLLVCTLNGASVWTGISHGTMMVSVKSSNEICEIFGREKSCVVEQEPVCGVRSHFDACTYTTGFVVEDL